MINWRTATMEEVSAHLEALAERQRAAFPEYTSSAQYAAEQRAPDPEDNTEDMG